MQCCSLIRQLSPSWCAGSIQDAAGGLGRPPSFLLYPHSHVHLSTLSASAFCILRKSSARIRWMHSIVPISSKRACLLVGILDGRRNCRQPLKAVLDGR